MRTLFLLAALTATATAQQTPPQPARVPAANPAAQSTPPPVQTIIIQPPHAPVTPPPAAPSAATTVPTMSPSDAYLYAMQPFANARAAPDDLTDADKWALGIGIARAKQQCEALSKQTLQDEDLLAFGKLCIFGQDFDPARRSLINYLALPQAKSPELGRLLLTRAFLGLHSIASAESQLESLLSLYPYDASIHLGIDLVVDAAAASDAVDDLDVIPRLNEQQLPHILDALAHGGAVPDSNGDSVDAAILVRDALRCADALRRAYKPDDANKILAQVSTLASADPIAHSANYPAIENALIRYQWLLHPSPIRSLHGTELPVTGPPIQRVVPLYDPDPAAHRIVRGSGDHTIIHMLDDRTLVLVFSLAGPASSATIQQILARLAQEHITPGLKVIAVTSYAANVGDDTANFDVFTNIRAFRNGLPLTLPVYLIPDTELKPFAIDMWPAAILFDGKGRILWLNTLSGSTGGIRQMERDMENMPPPPG
jgi:hypothetical protein